MTNSWIDGLLALVFNNTTYTLVGDAAGLLKSAADGSLYVSLHTGSPGVAGGQTTSEAAYTGYARVAVARTSGGWTVGSHQVVPAAIILFPIGTAGGETCTYVGIGTASSGAGGKLLYFGALSPSIVTGAGVIPEIPVTSTLTHS